MKLVALSCDAWDELLPAFADSTYEQTSAYAEVAWPGRETIRLGIASASGIAAACQVIVFTLPLVSRGLAVVKNGPLWRRRGIAPDPGARDMLLRKLIDEFAVRRRLGLRLLPHAQASPGDGVDAPAVGLGFRTTLSPEGGRYFVDLGLDENAQRASLSSSWRHKLRKAEAAAVKIVARSGSEAANEFVRLHGRMVSRKRYSERTWLAGLPDFMARIPRSYAPTIYFACRGGEILAGAVAGAVGETASYLYGASTEAALPLNAGYALQWHIIRELSARPDLRFYDLGGDSGSEGLRQFKSGLVGKAGKIAAPPGQFDYCSDPVSAALAAASRSASGMLSRARRLNLTGQAQAT